MEPLASFEDVAVRSPSGLPEDSQPRVNALLADASAVVRNYCKQTFASQRAVERIRPVGEVIRLPHRPVTAVYSVKVFYQGFSWPFSAYIWDGGEEIYLDVGGAAFINTSEAVREIFAFHTPMCDVDYESGYDSVPDDVKGVVATMVARAYVQPLNQLQSENVGPFSYQSSVAAAGGPLALDAASRQVLNTYKRVITSVELR